MTATLTHDTPAPWELLEEIDETKCERDDFLPAEVDYVYHPSFNLPHTERRLWGEDREEITVPRYSLLPEVAEEAPRTASTRSALTPGEEKTMFLRYNYAKFALCRALDRRRSPRRDEQVRLWHRRAQQTRASIVHANLALVPAMAKRVKSSHVEFGDLISEGYMAVLRSVEKFDVSRGFKFSTYACRSILACFHRLAAKAQRLHQRFNVEFDPKLERSDFAERRHERQRSDSIDVIRDILGCNRAGLTAVERRVILERYPVLSERKRRTLSQVGQAVGLSNERVRQIEKDSLKKIRAAFEEAAPA